MAGTHVHEGYATLTQINGSEGNAVTAISDQAVGDNNVGGCTLMVRHFRFERLDVGTLRLTVFTNCARGARMRPEFFGTHCRENIVTEETLIVSMSVYDGDRKARETANLIIDFGCLTGTCAGIHDKCPFQSEDQSGVQSVVVGRNTVHAVCEFNSTSHRYNPTVIFGTCGAIRASGEHIFALLHITKGIKVHHSA